MEQSVVCLDKILLKRKSAVHEPLPHPNLRVEVAAYVLDTVYVTV